MLKTRFITAIVLLACFIPIFLFSSAITFSLVIALVISLAAWEWGRFLWPEQKYNAIYFSLFTLQLLILILILLQQFDGEILEDVELCLPVILWISSIFWIFGVPFILRKNLQFSIKKNIGLLSISGLVIFVSDFYALILLREKGIWVLLTVLMIVWVADIGAYFTGKKWGKHKLAPQISPGKSQEGAIGGIFMVCVIALAFNHYNSLNNDFFSLIGKHYSVFGLIFISVFLASFSVIGDLFESQLKRLTGVKDSSNLLPGHGGVLDRLDALLPVLPIAALLMMGIS
jgi:phosphatidate cytidylyltransferase